MGRKLARASAWFATVNGFAVFLQLAACGQAPLSNGEPGAGRESQPTPASRAASGRYDLEKDEERGGHTLEKHVGRSDEELRQRLHRERDISAASTWSDRETAEVMVAEALSAERGRVERWMQRGYPRVNLALHYHADHPIGRSLRRGDDQVIECTEAVIVLRADGPDSFYVLTAYPEARE